tara:strand:+ start:112 stop:492 length:381 start_codon:yes stop_codon:yes gene_type:complete
MTRKVIKTNDAPQAIGVYSQGIKVDNLVFTSGQIPLTPNGELIKGNFESECRQVIGNIEAVLKASDCKLSDIIKLTVFLTDLSLFPQLNEVFKEFFIEEPPARSAVEVSGLPMGVRVEMEAIALAK